MAAITYDYYTIDLPGDMTDNIHDLASYAIDIAREHARLYCMPCDWHATHIKGEIGDSTVTFRVRRRRTKTQENRPCPR